MIASTMSRSGIHRKRRARFGSINARPIRASISSSPASDRKVRLVPMTGIRISTGRKVPMMLPIVEMAYMRPDTCPAVAVSSIASRMAKGETVPSSVTGMANRMSITPNEPTSSAAWMLNTARAATCNTGRATIGTRPAANAPHRITR